ncbi:hypothetical protein BAE46_10155 [Glaciecola punicea]|jgi:hypothetical protein|nr:hypothetical protein BAE46_10155 [Glaciecola punicea]
MWRVLVMFPYKQLNSVITFYFEHLIGKGTVLALSNNVRIKRARHQISEDYSKKLRLFKGGTTDWILVSYIDNAGVVKAINLTGSLTYANYKARCNNDLLPLCMILPNIIVKAFISITLINA